jgi:CRP/FNR family transcriptional regulator, cyclic AMP receptor protein
MRKVLFIFGDLTDEDIDWFAAAGERKSIPAGTVLVQQGKAIADVYILLHGQLSVIVSNEQGNITINTLQMGEIIGELSFLDSRPPTATVVAGTDAVVLAISRDKLAAKLARDAPFAAKFYRALGVFLADRLRSTTARLGFGSPDSLRAEDQTADEVDPKVLDSVAIAAKRFELLVERVTPTKVER